MRHDEIDLGRLLEDIEKYFDCRLSDEEEKNLRHRLANTGHVHPAIDEARALMGFARPSQRSGVSRRGTKIAAIAGVAAALAVVISLGWKLHNRPVEDPAGDVCLAYSGGNVITDEDAVLAIVAETMSEIHNGAFTANADLMDDVSMIAPAVDRYVINFDPVNVLL